MLRGVDGAGRRTCEYIAEEEGSVGVSFRVGSEDVFEGIETSSSWW